MGREIRRVPPNWEHPRAECRHKNPWRLDGCDDAKAHDGMCLQPMFDSDFDTALYEWVEEYELWKKGEHPHQKDYPYWEYAGPPPDPAYYHPKWEVEPTWYQVYETVSEGTPVTPPFATKGELVDYLVEHGDFWDQRRGDGGWKHENAEQFVNAGWAPSAWIHVGVTDLMAPRDGFSE